MSYDETTNQQRNRGRRAPSPHDLERWLSAEAEGREAAAEAALSTLFSQVDRLEPSPGFADRVLAGLASEPRERPVARAEARPSRLRWPLGLRGSLAAAFVALIGSWLLTPVLGVWVFGPAARAISVAEVLDGIGRGLEWMVGSVARVGDLWGLLSGVAHAIATAAGTLPVATVLLVGLGIAGLALRALSDLIARERSWSHVHFGG